MYDIGFQNLSRAMMSGKPIKVVVLDTQVYSNTGGQACTAGFFSQVSDMAPHGKVGQGKHEVRKEIGLIAMAHRTTYVMQSTIAHPNHMIEGFIQGLKARRPALFNLYAPCQPEHGIGDDSSTRQSKLAVESRAYPLFRYDPDAGPRLEAGLDLEGNPSPQRDWPTYELRYTEGGRQRVMTLPMTFADFAATETRFRKHFRHAPSDTWNDRMVPLAEFLELTPEQRRGRVAYIWSVDREQHLTRLVVAPPMVQACEDRRDFWTMLRGIARSDSPAVTKEAITAEVRGEITQRMLAGFTRWLGELDGSVPGPDHPGPDHPDPGPDHPDSGGESPSVDKIAASGMQNVTAGPAGEPSADGERMAPWIDSDRCTACDECVKTNPEIFAYDSNKKAFIKDPEGGPYQRSGQGGRTLHRSDHPPGIAA